jgi:hypothetical protein
MLSKACDVLPVHHCYGLVRPKWSNVFTFCCRNSEQESAHGMRCIRCRTPHNLSKGAQHCQTGTLCHTSLVSESIKECHVISWYAKDWCPPYHNACLTMWRCCVSPPQDRGCCSSAFTSPAGMFVPSAIPHIIKQNTTAEHCTMSYHMVQHPRRVLPAAVALQTWAPAGARMPIPTVPLGITSTVLGAQHAVVRTACIMSHAHLFAAS